MKIVQEYTHTNKHK